MPRKNLNRRAFVQSASAVTLTTLPNITIAKKDETLAIHGGKPVREQDFPEWPVIGKNDEENLMKALHRKEWCRLYGNVTTRFEQSWAKMLGAKHAIGVTNGTSALYAALYSVEAGPGDEVILSPYTFIATLNAVLQQHALPIFSDTDPQTFQMDPQSLDERISGNTRCILPVHIGGNVADMGKIMAIAKKKNIPVVEDACQAHLAEWGGKNAGAIGDIGCFSFQTTKILPCGEGGAVVTSDEGLYDKLHAFQNNGRDRKTGTRHGYQHQGGNLRMTELQAAILNAQLTRFEEQVRHRNRNADYLAQLLEDIPGITPAKKADGATRSTYYLYMMDYDKSYYNNFSKEAYTHALGREGIPCSRGYRPIAQEPFLEEMFNSRAYKNIYTKAQLDRARELNRGPQNEDVCNNRAIYFYHQMLNGTKEDIEQIAQAMQKIYNNRDKLQDS